MKKICTTTKVRQGNDGQMYYVSREILKFNQTHNGFVAIYKEELFDIVDSKIVVKEEYPQVDSEFTNERVASLFSLINQPILTSENFVDKFNALQVQAMLFDTINQTELGRYGTKEWIVYNEDQLLATT
ncbi:hypothetical protein ABMY20_15410 [Tenacibaculum sp. SSH1-16]|uniref:hypothetical protein n=1 Tax=Tenacibaculum sp. SSH1-16 TaxID=3136667 RepID=UPI0032C467DD